MVDKRPIGYIPGKGNPLDKKVPKSKKYSHILSSFTSGPTIRDISVMSDQLIAKRKTEIFKRIKTSTVNNFLQQERNFESIYNIAEDGQNESIYSTHSIRSSVSNISAVTYATERLGITDDTCFLLIDIREPEDYEKYHIREAVNLPAPNVSRDRFLPVIYRFKNQPDKMIIIYHSDERNGIPVATMFAEKGFTNVFLISGGMDKFFFEFPESVDGKEIPQMIRRHERGGGSDSRSQVSGISSSNTILSSLSQNKSLLSQNKSMLSQNKSMLSNAGKSVLQSQMPTGSDRQSMVSGSVNSSSTHIHNNQTRIVKRSNFKEYPETGDVRIKNDVEKEIQAIISNAAMRQALNANQAQSDHAFTSGSSSSNNNNQVKHILH